ncbi:uncharacterized protein LOC141590475 [Silene latifolia]|uniref:uncharacterized protein LOC141590475 n=1 Tax=Silene latifolia TaxID=37657 RepID=UPI003D7775AC
MYIRKVDPEVDLIVDRLLCLNSIEKYGEMQSRYSIFGSKRMIRGPREPTFPLSKYDRLGSHRKLLSEFLLKREEEKEERRKLKKQRQKEKEELQELKRQRQKEKEERRELRKQKRELKKQKKELKKIKKEKKELKKEKKELRKIKREKKELKKKKRAETRVNDEDEAPTKKLKLVEVEDNLENEKEMMNLEGVSSEDADQQRRCVLSCDPVGNLMADQQTFAISRVFAPSFCSYKYGIEETFKNMGAKKRCSSQKAAADPEPTDIHEEEVVEVDPPARTIAFKYQDSIFSALRSLESSFFEENLLKTNYDGILREKN